MITTLLLATALVAPKPVSPGSIMERIAFFTQSASTCRLMLEQENKDMWKWQKENQCKYCEPNRSTCTKFKEHTQQWELHDKRVRELEAKIKGYEQTCNELSKQL